MFLQPNTTHCGRYAEEYYKYERHNLIHTYISGGVSSVKVPSLPCSNNGGQLEGYDFSTVQSRKASYWYVLSQFGKMNPRGSKDFPYDYWLTSRFLLPYCLSAENDILGSNIGPKLMNTIQPKSISPSNEFNLYLKFEVPTDKVLRVVVVYSQLRAIAIEHDRTSSKAYESDQ